MIALIITAYLLIGVILGSALYVFADMDWEIATILSMFWPVTLVFMLLFCLANYMVIPLMKRIADKLSIK